MSNLNIIKSVSFSCLVAHWFKVDCGLVLSMQKGGVAVEVKEWQGCASVRCASVHMY